MSVVSHLNIRLDGEDADDGLMPAVLGAVEEASVVLAKAEEALRATGAASPADAARALSRSCPAVVRVGVDGALVTESIADRAGAYLAAANILAFENVRHMDPRAIARATGVIRGAPRLAGATSAERSHA
jgi:hypothetical protein